MTQFSDEIDLRPYIRLLLHRWWVMLTMGLLASIVVALLGMQDQSIYKAVASILISRERSTLELTDNFPTTIESVDFGARIVAIQQIAASDALLIQVIESLKAKDPSIVLTLAQLKEITTYSIRGDILLLEISYSDAEIAALLANSWADMVVQAVNFAYSADQPLEDIVDQMDSAEQTYREAQEKYENLISSTNVYVIESQAKALESWFDTMNQTQDVHLEKLLAYKQNLDILYLQANALLDQVNNAPESQAGQLGDAIAILLSRIKTFTFSEDSAVIGDSNLNINLDSLVEISGGVSYPKDVQAMIDHLTFERKRIDDEILALSQPSTLVQSDLYFQKSAELAEKQSLLEKYQTQLVEVAAERDIAWKAWNGLRQREVEVRSAISLKRQVNLSAYAPVPESPESNGSTMNIILAFFAGFVLGLVILIMWKWWQDSSLAE